MHARNLSIDTRSHERPQVIKVTSSFLSQRASSDLCLKKRMEDSQKCSVSMAGAPSKSSYSRRCSRWGVMMGDQ